MTDRLTAETARVGMRVRCVDADGMPRLTRGASYIIQKVDGGAVRLGGDRTAWFHADRFIPADPTTADALEAAAPSLRAILSERAPDLLAALVDMRAYLSGLVAWARTGREAQLLAAIERAGLLTEPSQPAPLPAMWCGVDAFEGEG